MPSIRYLKAPSDPEGVEFDARFGTETRWFDVWGNYEPVRPSVLDAALDAFGDPTGWTFVDWGSGKGRALIVASQRPFARVIGVEHRSALHDQAELNLAAAAARVPPACPVFSFVGTAGSHPLPDGPIAAYLYNPFGGGELRSAVERLRGREARLVYVNPIEEALVRELGWTVLAGGGTAQWRWLIAGRPPR